MRYADQGWGSSLAITSSAGWTLGAVVWVTIMATGACSQKQPRPAPPPPTYTGPAYLHGSVGSMTRLLGDQPLIVGGYGLVVNLNATGSSEVPAYLRQWLINEMRKKGVGSASVGGGTLSPEQMLASHHTTVVAVQGLVPPGATNGMRFDVWVTCLPQTQTTSLEGGRLWSTDLSIGGTSPSMRFSRKLAVAAGPTYINPLGPDTPDEGQLTLKRQAVVLSGGVVTTSRPLDLVLNQPSWQRSRLIADRINERFPKAPSDRYHTAVATDDSRIRLHVPARYAGRSQQLLELMAHLFVQRAPGFEQAKAQQLADLLTAQPRYASNVALAWVAMGRTVLPVMRQLYEHPHQDVRLTALEAGARLKDEAVTDPLGRLAQLDAPPVRRRVAKTLSHLPQSLRAARILHTLLDDEDRLVRIEAYESLAAINDPLIIRTAIDGPDPQTFKFVLDLIPAQKPLIYVAQSRWPRLVIFDPALGFRSPFLAKLWDNRLMLRSSAPDQALAVFFQKPGQVEGQTHDIKPTVADLVYLLAHRPSVASPAEGLDLSFGQVVGVMHHLCENGYIPSNMHLQINPLAAAIAQTAQTPADPRRPAVEPVGGISTQQATGRAPALQEVTDDPAPDHRPWDTPSPQAHEDPQ